MRTLYVLRHAKSDWSDPSLADSQRPLAEKGRKQVERLRRHAHTMRVDLVICSPAVRARATVEPLLGVLGAPMVISDDVYEAGPDRLLRVVAGLPDHATSVMLVGHMPGVALLLEELTGEYGDLPTGALATLAADVESWSDLADPARRRVRLVGVVTPKDLRRA